MTEKIKLFLKKHFSKGDAVFVAVTVAVILLLNVFVFEKIVVLTGSMENTIMTNDTVLGLRCSYWFKKPERFDVVKFEFHLDSREDYVKRIIGLPGEKVEIREGKIYINDSEEPLDEPYLWEDWVVMNDEMTFYVPEGYYLVLGDNRNNSSDSRYWQNIAYAMGLTENYEEAAKYIYIPEKNIESKVIIRCSRGLKFIS